MATGLEKKNKRKQLKGEYEAAWRHSIRQYYIRCAKRVIGLAPLPEFKEALNVFEYYDKNPSSERLECLRKVYRKLAADKSTRITNYGYTAVGEIYLGLLHIIWLALHPTQSCMSSDTQRFEEAAWCAARDIRFKKHGYEEQAMRDSDEAQSAIWKDTVGSFHERYGWEKEYISSKEEQAA